MTQTDTVMRVAHRREQAAQGWPLLRSLSNSSALICVAYLDAFSTMERKALLGDIVETMIALMPGA